MVRNLAALFVVIALHGTIQPGIGTDWTIYLPPCPGTHPKRLSSAVELADTTGDGVYASIIDTDGPMEVRIAAACNGLAFGATQSLEAGDSYAIGVPVPCMTAPLSTFDVTTSTQGDLTGLVKNHMASELHFTTTSVCGS